MVSPRHGLAPANGLPEPLKANIEAMSGLAMDDVRVHRNSSEPPAIGALAYAQGADIHVAPGQERHLPHEAWHVVQQKQGRVKATMQLKGSDINDDAALEAEADRMGAKASSHPGDPSRPLKRIDAATGAVQRRAGIEFETTIEARRPPPAVVPPAVPLAANADALRVTPNEVMADRGTWQIVSDNSALEFVTDPPVAIPVLRDVVDDMVTTLIQIPAALEAPADFNAHIGVGPVGRYNILPHASAVSGKMQGTVGIQFEKLPAFFTLLTTHNLYATTGRLKVMKKLYGPNPTDDQQAKLDALEGDQKAVSDDKIPAIGDIITRVDTATADLRDALDNIRTAQVKTQQIAELEKLRGLLMSVGQYIAFSKNYRKSYAKKSFPVMARTSFASMYKALNRQNKSKFLEIARRLVVDLGRTLDDAAFGAQAHRLSPDARFTLGEWLDSIVKGSVRTIPPKHPDGEDTTMVSDRMTAPGAFLNPTDASMGSMGLDNGKVVVELRGLRNNHPPMMMRAFVGDLAKLESTKVRPE